MKPPLATWVMLPLLIASAAGQVFLASRGHALLIIALMLLQIGSTAFVSMGLWRESRALKFAVFLPLVLLLFTFAGVTYDVVWRGRG